MRKGQTKVMVDAQGNSRIQEEKDGLIKVYTVPEWQAELARRDTEAGEPAPVADKPHDDGLIQEDTDTTSDELGAEDPAPTTPSMPKKRAKKASKPKED